MMKRGFLILLMCVMGVAAQADFALTPHLAGEFNSWNEAANPMTETSLGSGIWTLTITGQPANTRQGFKVTDGTWSSSYPPANSWYYTDGAGEVTVTFNANTVSDGWLPEQNRLGLSKDPGTWTIAGSFGGAGLPEWDNAGAGMAMTPVGGGIYLLSQTLPAGTYDWKAVVTGSWDSISTETRSENTANGSYTVTEASEIVDFYVDALTGTVGIGLDVPLPWPYNPDPARDDILPYNTVTDLSWANPAPLVAGPLAVSVKFELEPGGVYDPNWTNPSTASGSDIETIALSAMTNPPTLPLADNSLYSWQVTVIDPNGGVPTPITGDVWLFEIGDAPPVMSNKPVDQYMFLSQDDFAVGGIGDTNPDVRYFEVTATYTDDGKSTVVADMNNLNWGWDPDGVNGEVQRGVTEVSDTHTPGVGGGTVTAIYKTEYNAADPNYTTDLPGLWNIRLEVTDGTGTVLGATGYHRITETCLQAAAEDPDDTFASVVNADGTDYIIGLGGDYDKNSDCIISLADFTDFAAVWLNQGVKYE